MLLFVIGFVLIFASLKFHFVVAPDCSFHVIPKQQLTFSETFVNFAGQPMSEISAIAPETAKSFVNNTLEDVMKNAIKGLK